MQEVQLKIKIIKIQKIFQKIPVYTVFVNVPLFNYQNKFLGWSA